MLVPPCVSFLIALRAAGLARYSTATWGCRSPRAGERPAKSRLGTSVNHPAHPPIEAARVGNLLCSVHAPTPHDFNSTADISLFPTSCRTVSLKIPELSPSSNRGSESQSATTSATPLGRYSNATSTTASYSRLSKPTLGIALGRIITNGNLVSRITAFTLLLPVITKRPSPTIQSRPWYLDGGMSPT